MGAFLLCALVSLVVGWLGRKRRFGFWGYFFCSLAFTPIVGLIILLASDPKDAEVRDTTAGTAHTSS